MAHSVISIELQPFDPGRHFALVDSWLHNSHVARWWGPPSDALTEISSHDERTAALICLNSRPVGLLCWQTLSPRDLSEAFLTDLPDDLVDIDIMIGEVDALGRGVGTEALRLLFERLRAHGVQVVGMATSTANERALAAYAKAGLLPFRDFIEHGEQYRYLTKKLVDAA
jgi:aminoglycoside 6'-N-acetyltransferase